jgi:hypothetical protein
MEETESSTLFDSNNFPRIRRISRLEYLHCAKEIVCPTEIAYHQAHATPIRESVPSSASKLLRLVRATYNIVHDTAAACSACAILDIDAFTSIFAGLQSPCIVHPFELGQ